MNAEYEDYDELMPLGSLKVFDCGLNTSPEDAQWFEKGRLDAFWDMMAARSTLTDFTESIIPKKM